MYTNLNNWSAACRLHSGTGLLVLVLLAVAPVDHLHAAIALYGEDYVRVGESQPDDEAAPIAFDDTEEITTDGAAFLQQVELLEQQQGPYADALAEPLASLARAAQRQGEIELAQRLYRRALHIVRVNDGLYSQRQVPILQELLDSYRLAGDLEGLDERYDYYFRLFGMGQPPLTDMRLRAALEYLRWQREALRLGLGDEKRRMLELHKLNDDLLKRVRVAADLDPEWRRQLVVGQLRNLYLIDSRVQPGIQDRDIIAGANYFDPAPANEDLGNRRLENIQRGLLGTGVDLLEGLLESSPDMSQVDRARLTLELADWYLWNRSTSRATKRYLEVERLLIEAGENALLEEWLSSPAELPASGVFWQRTPSPLAGEPAAGVAASFDVSARGKARNIETAAAGEEGRSQATRLRRLLSQTRFRPRLVDGKGVPAEQLQRQYQLID